MINSLYLSHNIRDIEIQAQLNLPAFTLMQRAGHEVAKYVSQNTLPKSTILVLAGTGNNGGDALEAASLLSNNYRVIILYKKKTTYTHDALTAFEHAQASSATFIDFTQYKSIAEIKLDLIIDGLFGIGLKRPITGIMLDIIDYINRYFHCPVIAVDVPSGLNPDTGTKVSNKNQPGIVLKATTTITFIGNKPGLHTNDGIDYCGKVIVKNLDIAEKYFPPSAFLLLPKQSLLPYFSARRANTHKGSFGDVVVIGGEKGTAGAAILAARSALYGGAGRVYVCFEDMPFAYDPVQPELMIKNREFIINEKAAIVIGPGLGCTAEAISYLSTIIDLPNQLVLDADALNIIADNKQIRQQLLNKNNPPVIITPHPLEAARLLQTNVAEIQANRIGAAQQLAELLNVYVILKGAGTVVATPNAYCTINTTGNAGLATAGTGDVLAGLCGALLAQQIPIEIVAAAAPWIHGKAADSLVKQGVGPIGLTASELFSAIRITINDLTKVSHI